jgi:chemotaxis protein methyltransferase CheR
MKDDDCTPFLQEVLPRLQLRWLGFRKVRRQVCKRVQRRIALLGLSDVQAYRAWLDTHPDELISCGQAWLARFPDHFC